MKYEEVSSEVSQIHRQFFPPRRKPEDICCHLRKGKEILDKFDEENWVDVDISLEVDIND